MVKTMNDIGNKQPDSNADCSKQKGVKKVKNYGTADKDCHHKKIYIKIKFNMKSLQKSTFIFTFV